MSKMTLALFWTSQIDVPKQFRAIPLGEKAHYRQEANFTNTLCLGQSSPADYRDGFKVAYLRMAPRVETSLCIWELRNLGGTGESFFELGTQWGQLLLVT